MSIEFGNSRIRKPVIKCLATLSALAVAVAMAACTVHQSDSAPPLTGPSDFAQSITITSTPDRLTQDGQSQSAITVRVFDASGSAAVGVPIRLDMLVGGTLVDFGTLSARNLVTGGDGRATAVYTAAPAPPPASQGSNTVTIRAIAVGSNAQTTNGGFSTDIRLVPPGVILPPAGTPTASFTFSPSPASLNVPLNFDASASLPGTNAILVSYQWNFGDGSSASGRTISKTFTTPGTFNVTLTVTNDRGLAASTTQVVSVGTTTAPTAAFTFSPTAPAVNQAVNFNAVASIAAPGRSIASYAWNFGDGSAAKTGVTSQHDFGAAGTYSVSLTVTDDVGQRSTASQAVTVASGGGGGGSTTAAFTFSPLTPSALQPVFFNASGSSATTGHTLTSYAWNFGDGTLITGPTFSATHTFTAAGTFTVTLVVTDDIGQTGRVATPVVVAAAGAGSLTADFSISPTDPTSGQLVTFNANLSAPIGSIVSYDWDFGDGVIVNGQTSFVITHTYFTATGNTFTIRLTVHDNTLRVATTTHTVTVKLGADPVARFTVTPSPTSINTAVNFDGSASTAATGRAIVRYEWDFGDGSPVVSTTIPTTSSYRGRGTLRRGRTIRLTVFDNAGVSAATTHAPGAVVADETRIETSDAGSA